MPSAAGVKMLNFKLYGLCGKYARTSHNFYTNTSTKLEKIMRFLALLTFAILTVTTSAQAQNECTIGEIRMFAGNFAPRDWALCNGQLLSISTNTALFSILGTTYGGDGRNNFQLPDLRGRFPIHPGSGPGLTPKSLGQKGGQEEFTLAMSEMPTHSHSALASSLDGQVPAPEGNVLAAGKGKNAKVYSELAPDVEMSSSAIGSAGGNQAHDNMPPYQRSELHYLR